MKKHFVVTISREFGAEGHEVGRVLAQRLNVNLYDKETLQDMLTRRERSKEGSYSDCDAIEEQFMKPYVEDGGWRRNEAKFNQEAQLIRDIADKESCIIVGRLADYILRQEENIIKAYIYAPEEARIKLIQEKHKISEKAAKKLTKDMDTARKDYYAYYSLHQWSQKTDKDIMLNRSAFGIEGCVDILEAAINTSIKED